MPDYGAKVMPTGCANLVTLLTYPDASGDLDPNNVASAPTGQTCKQGELVAEGAPPALWPMPP
jgi:hypothetical protein